MNYNVPTPEQLFQVAQREYPEAPVHREEENEKEIETIVEIEEIVVEIETKDCESSFSDPIQMTPSPGAKLIVVQEAKIRLEYTAEIAPAASLAEDYADLWKRPECHQIEGNVSIFIKEKSEGKTWERIQVKLFVLLVSLRKQIPRELVQLGIPVGPPAAQPFN
ncbi:hypothetical protein XENTR_v10022758 [Xenopus tropicalis]|nr:hypothetical protein XENTR_v10022758 [Xenopus tropicalis]